MNLPKGNHFGLIADEVQQVLPGLVKETKFYTAKSDTSKTDALKNATDIDFKALNYTELIPVIIKAMQEQQQIIQDLQNENNQMRQQLNDLKQMIPGAQNASGAILNTGVKGAYVLQNTPNPAGQNATIHYYVPASVKQARLMIYSMNGSLIRSYSLNNGENDVTISAGTLPAGIYLYTLWADGEKVDTKNMSITK